MEFWGVEVKAGEPLKVELEVGRVLHLSQACLGEVKKDKGHESVYLFVNVDEKKLVLGTLTPEKLPQQIFDLVFDKDFELTHNWKNGSVFFCGYIADNPFEQSEDEDTSDSESEEDVPVIAPNIVPSTQVKQEKPAAAENANVVKDSAAGKQKVKIVEPNKDMKIDDDEDEDCSSDDDAMSTDDSDDVEVFRFILDSKDGSDEDDDDDSDEEDEQTPQEVQPSKKRAMESAKTPVTDKKAKFVTPQKADGKKGIVHVATPHPSKQAGKSNQQTPKSEGSHSCKPCNRSFKSENALESHNKAKHTAGK